VEPSVSPYNSPLLLVPKKSLPNSENKKLRLVIDYRQINKKLLSDKFPLPRIDDIGDRDIGPNEFGPGYGPHKIRRQQTATTTATNGNNGSNDSIHYKNKNQEKKRSE